MAGRALGRAMYRLHCVLMRRNCSTCRAGAGRRGRGGRGRAALRREHPLQGPSRSGRAWCPLRWAVGCSSEVSLRRASRLDGMVGWRSSELYKLRAGGLVAERAADRVK